jgi:hypothetical protein
MNDFLNDEAVVKGLESIGISTETIRQDSK